MRKFRDVLLVVIIVGLVVFLVWKYKHPIAPIGPYRGGVATVVTPSQPTGMATSGQTTTEAVIMTQTTGTVPVVASDTTGTTAITTTSRVYEEYHVRAKKH